MQLNQTNATLKALATGLIVGSLALAGLGAGGCDRISAEDAAALASVSATAAAVRHADEEKPDLRSKITLNHNETFLIGTRA